MPESLFTRELIETLAEGEAEWHSLACSYRVMLCDTLNRLYLITNQLQRANDDLRRLHVQGRMTDG